MAGLATRPGDWIARRCLEPWRLPKVGPPGVSGGLFTFDQADLVVFWLRLRAPFILAVAVAALVVAIDWGAAAWQPLLIAGLAAALLVDALVRLRRRSADPLPVLMIDATALGLGLALVQLEVHAVIAPLLYAGLSAAMLLPWRRAMALWCFDIAIGVAVVETAAPLGRWLGFPASLGRSDAAVWITTGVFGLLCLVLTLVLTGANRRFTLAQQTRLAYQTRRKDEFLAGVSHALRTPLTCVVGFGQIIERDWAEHLPAPVGVMLAELNQQADQMAAMVENLVVRAQDQAGGITLAPGPVNLHEAADGVIRSQAWLYPDKEIRLHGRPEVTAWADPTATRLVIRNLVTNAIQHGGEHVEVAIGNGAWATVAVSDDAAGPVTCGGSLHIAPFAKADPTFAAPHLGLGLPTSLRLAELMGGGLTHQHVPGRSTFTLALPVRTAEEGLQTLAEPS